MSLMSLQELVFLFLWNSALPTGLHALTTPRALPWYLVALFLEGALPLVNHKTAWFPESAKGSGEICGWLVYCPSITCSLKKNSSKQTAVFSRHSRKVG